MESLRFRFLGFRSGSPPTFTVPSGKPPFETSLTIDVSVTTPEGSYQLSVDSSGAGKSHATKIALNIQKSKQTSTLSLFKPDQQGDSCYRSRSIGTSKTSIHYLDSQRTQTVRLLLGLCQHRQAERSHTLSSQPEQGHGLLLQAGTATKTTWARQVTPYRLAWKRTHSTR